MFRGSTGAFLLGFVMPVAALISFGRNAPTAVGALFLVAMVAGFVLAARTSGQIKAASRVAQRQAQPGEPWQD